MYCRAYINWNIGITILEGEGYDPNKINPDRVDDSVPWNLDELEQDSLLR